MKAKRKPLTELCVKGNFTEDREERQKELQRHGEEVCADHEETKEVQENRIDCFKKKGCQQSTVDGREAEITVDLLLQARAKMSDNKVNEPEDAVVSEMIKIVKKPGAEPMEGTRSYSAIALTSFEEARILCCSSPRTRDGTIKMEATACGRIEWNKLSTPVSATNLPQKTLGTPGEQNLHVEAWQCSAPHQRPTSMNTTKTAFEAKMIKLVPSPSLLHHTHASGYTDSTTLCRTSHASGLVPSRFHTCVLPPNTAPRLCPASPSEDHPRKQTTSRLGSTHVELFPKTCWPNRRGIIASPCSPLSLVDCVHNVLIIFPQICRWKRTEHPHERKHCAAS